ncbi:hypothetical protein [Erythrobacter mangrovi]|uniref:Uncharacterized protein n=1 Tax=Erythrobacter mangrovi TaxID=2739433 RepID=A0A7D3X9N5_9SPHN|nr:hypothetical protein [Erythrobacter mangrovi]QKG70140.1 hypothetical protein HQR01_01460 [Erythrobacter mangrovi]
MAHFFDMSRKPVVPELADVSGGNARRERTIQRLQIGVTGVVLMILLVGLASVIQNRAAETDATAVPEAAATTEPTTAATQSDPLVEAGVVPDMPAQPAPATTVAPTPAQADAAAPAQ